VRIAKIYLSLGFLILLSCATTKESKPTESKEVTEEITPVTRYSEAEKNYSFAFEYMRQDNYEKAETLLNKAIQDSSTYVDAYVALRKIYLILGDTSKAIALCKSGLSCLEEITSKPSAGEYEKAARKLTLALADLYTKIGESEKAEILFAKIIKENPEEANSYDLYASYLEKQGEIDKAIEYYKKAYQYEPENKGIAFRLGDAYFLAHRYKDAAKFFKSAEEAFPGDIDIMKKLAQSYMELEQYKLAIDEYKAILEIAPKHVSSRIIMGNAYTKLREYEKARQCYQRALEIEPNNLSVYYQLVNMELTRNNLSAVDRYLKESFKIAPNDPILLSLYGEYYYRLGVAKMKNKEWNPALDRFEKAIQIWNKTISKAPEYKWKIYAQEGIKRAEKMIEEIKKVRW